MQQRVAALDLGELATSSNGTRRPGSTSSKRCKQRHPLTLHQPLTMQRVRLGRCIDVATRGRSAHPSLLRMRVGAARSSGIQLRRSHPQGREASRWLQVRREMATRVSDGKPEDDAQRTGPGATRKMRLTTTSASSLRSPDGPLADARLRIRLIASACRPASVIRTRTTSVCRPPATMRSRFVVASPAWTSSTSMSTENPLERCARRECRALPAGGKRSASVF
jgi:hypothetical protein